MKKVIVGVLGLATAGWLINVGCVGDTPVAAVPDATSDAPIVQTCSKPSDCKTLNCVDGVCCDTPCDGVCESCKVAGSEGKCTAIADGQDPDNECVGVPLDAGTEDAGDAALNLPDGGVALDDSKCGGKCNGKRACALADSKVTCGTAFCNTTTQQGRPACDSKGHCELQLETCQGYSCPDGTGDAGAANGCLTQCTGESDCQPTHYCQQGKCISKLGNGSPCGSVTQCQSGHCISNVCCNDECQITGGSCTSSGKVGQCTCPACSTGPCTLWYKDGDNDGFGDMTGTIGNGRAVVGCAQLPDAGPPTPPQAGFVLDNTDCFDGLNTVHPGQASYFTTPYGPNNSFDYDCSNTISKQYAEYVGGSCGFCGGALCTNSSTCISGGTSSNHLCYKIGKFCSASGNAGFHAALACGQQGTYYTCGTCAVAGGTANVTTTSRVQGCH